MTGTDARLVAMAGQMDALASAAERHIDAGNITAAVAAMDQAEATEHHARMIAEQSGDERFTSVWAER